MRKVSIVQREIPHYRIRFFEELYAQGKLLGLEIQVYTEAPPATGSLIAGLSLSRSYSATLRQK